MTHDEIIRMAREAQLAYGTDDSLLCSVEKFFKAAYEAGAAAERNKIAAWMMANGYATGHGDTTDDLLGELGWQIAEGLKMERAACAKVCDDIDVEYEGEDVLATWCAAAIRARGKE